MATLALELRPLLDVNDEQFYQLCQLNGERKLERNAQGEVLIMSLTGGETGRINMKIAFQLEGWNMQANLGEAFDSSTGFKLPNGAIRSPDSAWIRRDRWLNLTPESRRKIPPIAPDFVIELRSTSDDLETLQDKMVEYLDNGVRLGWLIDPDRQIVEIYQPGLPPEILVQPSTISGLDILPGFILDFAPIFGV
jgi:Uma2 family endonuclease